MRLCLYSSGVERCTRNAKVASSNLAGGILFLLFARPKLYIDGISEDIGESISAVFMESKDLMRLLFVGGVDGC